MNTAIKSLPYLMTDTAITVFFGANDTHTAHKGDARYKKVLTAIREGRWGDILQIMDVKGQIVKASKGDMQIINGTLYSNDYVVPTSLGNRIVKIVQQGLPVSSYVNFLENLNENPDPAVVDQVFGFVEHCTLPIDPDGMILAYKMVTNDFLDIYSKSVDNSVGQVVELDRELCDSDPNRTCSSGLHFCSEGYLGSYGCERRHDRMVVVRINPRDVVSVPTDYNFAKARCCRYEVVDTIDWSHRLREDYEDAYTPPVEETTEDETAPADEGTRWEIRDSEDGVLLDVFATRKRARKERADLDFDTFIWDSLKGVATGPHPEEWDVDVDLTADDDDEEDETPNEASEDARWEVRKSSNGDLLYSFSSRKYARQYVNDDECIWDAKLQKMEKGFVNVPNWKP